MSWTQNDLATLERAVATGARKVRYADGREVTYHSLKEMLALLDVMKAALAGGTPRVSHAKFTRA